MNLNKFFKIVKDKYCNDDNEYDESFVGFLPKQEKSNQSMEKPRACPFCGKDVIIDKLYHDVGSLYKTYHIKCSNINCPIHPTAYNFYSRRDAIKAWNTRAE